MTINNTRNRRQTKKQENQQRRLFWLGGSIIAIIAVIGIVIFINSNNREAISFPDIHGMSFTGNGNELRVATHVGLVAYEDDSWSRPELPINDYMGYSGNENGFFSSGHPGVGSSLPNPVGLVRSNDHGKNVTTVNFSGESDFHVMGAAYYSDTIYVVNPVPNSILPAGLHYSVDGGETWQQSEARGLTANPIQIAVHPRDSNTVVVATQQGLFSSNDFGETFRQISDNGIVTSVAFDPEGDRILFGFNTLYSFTINSERIEALPQTPQIDEEQAILYIAINPITEDMAIATTDRDIFYSADNGESWDKIGDNGSSV